jgi:hypothetical protein
MLAEDLDVADRVERETFGDPVPHDRQQLSHPLFCVRGVDEVEVAAFGKGEIGHQAVINPMRIDDDAALGSLPEDLGQAHDRHRSRRSLNIELQNALNRPGEVGIEPVDLLR